MPITLLSMANGQPAPPVVPQFPAHPGALAGRLAARFALIALTALLVTLPLGVPALWDFVALKLGLSRGVYLIRPSENQAVYAQMGMIVVGLANCAWRVVAPPARLARNSILLLVPLFAGMQFLSATSAQSPEFALKSLLVPASGMLGFAFLCTVQAGRRDIEKMFLLVVLVSLPLSLYAIAQSQGFEFLPYSRFVTEGGGEEIGTKQKVSSLFGHPNYMASYLSPLVFWCMYFTLSRFGRPVRVTAGVAALSIVMALVVGGTRGGWVAVIAAGVPYYVLLTLLPRFRRQLLFAAGLALVVAVALLVIPNPLLRVQFDVSQRVFASTEISARFYYWMMALEMLRESPFLGIGYGHYNVLFWNTVSNFQQTPDSEFLRFILVDGIRGVLPGFVHNDFLQIATETGLLGLAVWLAIWTALVAQIWEAARNLGGAPRALLMAATFMAAFSAFAVDGVFNFPLHLPVSGFLFWILLGAWVAFREYLRRLRDGLEDEDEPSPTAGIAPEIPRVRFPRTKPKRR